MSKTQAIPEEESDRRRELRVTYRADCTIMLNNQCWEAYIINLSETGALIALLSSHPITTGTDLRVNIALDEDTTINMEGKVVHIRDHYLGLGGCTYAESDANRLKALLSKIHPPL